jgi:hypothetical protein
VALNKYMGKNESTKRKSKNKASRIKHQICYTYRDKGHLSKDCPKTQTFIHKIVKVNLSHVKPKNDTSITKLISSSCNSPCDIWVPTRLLYQNLLDQVVGGLRCIGSLTIKEKMIQIATLSRA